MIKSFSRIAQNAQIFSLLSEVPASKKYFKILLQCCLNDITMPTENGEFAENSNINAAFSFYSAKKMSIK